MPEYEFRWNAWNLDHIGRHGISPLEAEYVVIRSKPPYPEYRGDGKWLVIGRTHAGPYLQVIFVFDSISRVYVIHARGLTEREKRRYRRRRK